MGRDIGDIVAGSLLRHAVLGFLTGGVGNVIALAVDAMDGTLHTVTYSSLIALRYLLIACNKTTR